MGLIRGRTGVESFFSTGILSFDFIYGNECMCDFFAGIKCRLKTFRAQLVEPIVYFKRILQPVVYTILYGAIQIYLEIKLNSFIGSTYTYVQGRPRARYIR